MAPTYVGLKVRRSGVFFAGVDVPEDDKVNSLVEAKVRKRENYNQSPNLQTGVVEVNIRSRYQEGGRVFVRQVDPRPLRILSVGIDGHF